MSDETSFLLLQSIEEATLFDFENKLLSQVRAALPESPYFHIDNLSDGITVNYAKQFITEADHLLIICDEVSKKQLGALLPILNVCVKRKNTQLLVLGDSPLLKPFLKMMRGEYFENLESLLLALAKGK